MRSKVEDLNRSNQREIHMTIPTIIVGSKY